MHPIAEILEPVLGRPSWLVQLGYGTFITMEFGEPRVHVSDPVLRKIRIDGAPERARTRTSTVGGQWHLWVYCCQWSLLLGDIQLAHSESDDATMHRALHVQDGQALTAVNVEPAGGATHFTFDLGCSLLTCPDPPGTGGDTEPAVQWYLYERSGPVLAVRDDGCYEISDRREDSANDQWLPIGTPVRLGA
jgi:hypothetical protein